MCGAIHLADFPRKGVTVFLEDDARRDLIDTAIDIFDGRKGLAQYLSINKLDTISRWKEGTVNRGKGWITRQGIPIDQLAKLSEIVVSKGYNNFSLDKLEKNVTMYKGIGKAGSINNPILPIRETPELFRIISHLMGDGSALESSTSYFKNFDKKVYDEFKTDLNKVFGDVEVTLTETVIIFPIVIRHILSHFYGIEFGTFSCRLPQRLFGLPKKYAAYSLQAFGDDESCVHTHRISFYSFNKLFLNDFRKLLRIKFPKISRVTTPVKSRKRPTGIEYWFEIHAHGLSKYKKEIGFTHAEKSKFLDFLIGLHERKWNNRGPGYTKRLILESLVDRPKTNKEIAYNVGIGTGKVASHITGYMGKKGRVKGLSELGLVKFDEKAKYGANLWKITNKGKLSFDNS